MLDATMATGTQRNQVIHRVGFMLAARPERARWGDVVNVMVRLFLNQTTQLTGVLVSRSHLCRYPAPEERIRQGPRSRPVIHARLRAVVTTACVHLMCCCLVRRATRSTLSDDVNLGLSLRGGKTIARAEVRGPVIHPGWPHHDRILTLRAWYLNLVLATRVRRLPRPHAGRTTEHMSASSNMRRLALNERAALFTLNRYTIAKFDSSHRGIADRVTERAGKSSSPGWINPLGFAAIGAVNEGARITGHLRLLPRVEGVMPPATTNRAGVSRAPIIPFMRRCHLEYRNSQTGAVA